MDILGISPLESNKKMKFNFKGGDLSSDAGLIMIREFAHKIGLNKLIRDIFITYGSSVCRRHTDADNLMQLVYQCIAAYFKHNYSDERINDAVMTVILEKDRLASQSPLSRLRNCMDNDTITLFNQIDRYMRRIVYGILHPDFMLFDLVSMLLNTYRHLEGEGFNFQYQAHGYHPLFCYDGLTGDLLKAELRDGTTYCSNGAADNKFSSVCAGVMNNSG